MATLNTDYNYLRLCGLYDRACEVAGGLSDSNQDYAPCRWLYRNQSLEYFSEIHNWCDGLMEVRLKDDGGDPDSPINGRLSGLFFMASVRKGSLWSDPLPMSPFGPCRLMVPAEDLLGTSNVYFTDFYCMTNSGYHYVTLVITVPGSKADTFCKKHLPSVDMTCNPFLFYHDDYGLCVTTQDRLLVEVFYTEDLDISEYIMYDNIPIIGRGHSTRGGIAKRESCDVCNPHFDSKIHSLAVRNVISIWESLNYCG